MIRRITESVSELRSMLPDGIVLPDMKSESRLKEWLGERVILQELLGEYTEIGHRPDGAPYLPGRPEYISISHTGEYVAVQLNDKPFGIDIERIGDRALRLGERFLSTEEMELLKSDDERQNALRAVLFWSAKEAVFKASSTDLSNFKDHIRLTFIPDNHSLTAQELCTPGLRRYAVSYSVCPEYVLTQAFPL